MIMEAALAVLLVLEEASVINPIDGAEVSGGVREEEQARAA